MSTPKKSKKFDLESIISSMDEELQKKKSKDRRIRKSYEAIERSAGELLEEFLPDSVFISGSDKTPARREQYKKISEADLRKALAPDEDPSTIMQPENVAEVISSLLDTTGDYIDQQNIIIRKQMV